VPVFYREFYDMVGLACGEGSTFKEYKEAFDVCYEMPRDELELHIRALNARASFITDENKE
jgi:hypothetical protein